MKKNIKKFLIFIFAAQLLFCLSCSQDSFSVKRDKVTTKLYKKQKIIKIACTSSWKKNNSLQWEGIVMAKNEINEAGGVNGAKIELIKLDDNKDKKSGLYIAYDIAKRPDITAVIGHSNSGIAVSASQVYQYYGLLMFSPMATAQKLTSRGFANVFRNIPQATKFAKAAAAWCKSKDLKDVIICYVDTEYGEDIANAFELACSKNDVSIVERDSYSSIDEKAFFEKRSKWWEANFNYDAIFLAGSMPQLKTIIESIRESGVKQPIVGTDSFDYPELESWIVENDIKDIYALTSFDSDSDIEEYKVFRKNFENIYGKEPDQEAVQGYEALKTIANAITKADSVKTSDLIETLKSNSWSGIIGRHYRFNQKGDIVGIEINTLDYNKIRERKIQEKEAAEKLEEERLEAEKLETERLEAEKLEAEKREAKRLEAEKIEAKRLEAEKFEAERKTKMIEEGEKKNEPAIKTSEGV